MARLFGILLVISLADEPVFAQSRETTKALETEMAGLFERVKSPSAAEREAAVSEFMGVREAVALALRQIVLDADSGRTTEPGKALALSLMGMLRLAQCADAVQVQVDRGWKPRVYTSYVSAYSLWAIGDLRPMVLPNCVSVAPGGASVDLAAYPKLRSALTKIGAQDAKPEEAHREAVAILYWHDEVVQNGLSSILDTGAYSDDVKIAAAWLLGEYRIRSDGLLNLMDVRDERALTATYPARLQVTGPGSDAEYPAVIALLKAGPLSPSGIIEEIASRNMSQSGRDRAARLLMLTDPEGAREALAEKTVAYTAEKDQAVLRSLGDIIH